MTYVIEARPSIVIKRKALVYKAETYPPRQVGISDYNRIMLYPERK